MLLGYGIVLFYLYIKQFSQTYATNTDINPDLDLIFLQKKTTKIFLPAFVNSKKKSRSGRIEIYLDNDESRS
jgi:hypothetical protein